MFWSLEPLEQQQVHSMKMLYRWSFKTCSVSLMGSPHYVAVSPYHLQFLRVWTLKESELFRVYIGPTFLLSPYELHFEKSIFNLLVNAGMSGCFIIFCEEDRHQTTVYLIWSAHTEAHFRCWRAYGSHHSVFGDMERLSHKSLMSSLDPTTSLWWAVWTQVFDEEYRHNH